jgi:cystathionine beta-lyase/cystathionine gamma-synthase
MKLETILAQAGSRWDTGTGAVSIPIYQSATFRHPALGESTGFDYSRTANPTRSALEETVAWVEGGNHAMAFGSGMAAIDTVFRLFEPGSRIVASEDLYGGTFRLLEQVFRKFGLEIVFVDTSDTIRTADAVREKETAALFIEIPTNPLLKVADLTVLGSLARENEALFIVDNTFLTPYLLKPLEFGADIVIYSATKYLGGHNDVVAGLVVTKNEELAERISFFQNAAGAVLGPMDSWLILRGLKTLPLRLEKQQKNAQAVAEFLDLHPRVRKVYYPGLSSDPGNAVLRRQAKGFGAIISFEVEDAARVDKILSGVDVFLFAESLGGVESLITFPAVQTHADLDPVFRESVGINDRLLRLSIGIEDAEDLLADLDRVL